MSGWELFSSHGLVLIYFSRNPRARLRDAAEAIGLTERAVQNNIRDLAASGHLVIEKVGRRNRYRVVGRKHLTHPTTRSVSLRQLLQLFKIDEPEKSTVATAIISKPVSQKTEKKKSTKSMVKPIRNLVAEPIPKPEKLLEIVDTAIASNTPKIPKKQKPAEILPGQPKATKKDKPKRKETDKDDDLPQQDLLF